MPQWAGSCWYYLRYVQPSNAERLVDPAAERYWLPVDLYVGARTPATSSTEMKVGQAPMQLPVCGCAHSRHLPNRNGSVTGSDAARVSGNRKRDRL